MFYSLNRMLTAKCHLFDSSLRHMIIYQKRFITARKRFYKSVTVTQNDGKFEINIDKKKLKTPLGHVLYTKSEPLAYGIANEWDSQKEFIKLTEMHLTSLTNTAIDNPLNYDKSSLTNCILKFIDTDTLCFRTNELTSLQQLKWDPIIEWFQKRYDCTIPITNGVQLEPIDNDTIKKIERHLLSHNYWSLIGVLFAAENLKSLILTLALTERRIGIDDAISLSRLEEEFQIKMWGNVEWAHDFDVQNLRMRVSASIIFYFFNCETNDLAKKGNSLSNMEKS